MSAQLHKHWLLPKVDLGQLYIKSTHLIMLAFARLRLKFVCVVANSIPSHTVILFVFKNRVNQTTELNDCVATTCNACR